MGSRAPDPKASEAAKWRGLLSVSCQVLTAKLSGSHTNCAHLICVPPPALWVLGEMLRSSDCSSILRPGFIFGIDLPHKPKPQTATGLLAATAPGGTATCEAMILTASRHHDYQAPTTASALLGEVLRTGTMCSALLVQKRCALWSFAQPGSS